MQYTKNPNNRVNVFFSWEYLIKYYIQFSECYLTWGRLAEVVTISPPYSFAWEWELSQTFYCPHPQSASKTTNFLSSKNIHVSVVPFSCHLYWIYTSFVLNLHFSVCQTLQDKFKGRAKLSTFSVIYIVCISLVFTSLFTLIQSNIQWLQKCFKL